MSHIRPDGSIVHLYDGDWRTHHNITLAQLPIVQPILLSQSISQSEPSTSSLSSSTLSINSPIRCIFNFTGDDNFKINHIPMPTNKRNLPVPDDERKHCDGWPGSCPGFKICKMWPNCSNRQWPLKLKSTVTDLGG